MKETTEHRITISPITRDQRRAGIIFIILPMVLFVTFSVYPMLYASYISLTNYSFNQSTKYVGAANFSRLLQDNVFQKAIANTGLYTLGVVPSGMALSIFLAIILNQKIRGITLFRIAFYLPVVTSTVAAGMIWLRLYAPSAGLINQVLASTGLPPQRWLFDPKLALASVMVMSVWKTLGYTTVIYLAALQGVPVHLYEAAEIDGATFWDKLINISLPLLKPATLYVLITSVISSFQVFGSVYVMTKGGPGHATTTIVHQIYLNGFRYLRMGYASAEALVLFVIIFSLSMINWHFLKSDVEYW